MSTLCPTFFVGLRHWWRRHDGEGRGGESISRSWEQRKGIHLTDHGQEGVKHYWLQRVWGAICFSQERAVSWGHLSPSRLWHWGSLGELVPFRLIHITESEHLLTEDSQSRIGRNASCAVLGCAAVHPDVLYLHIHDKEHVILRHNVHAPLPGGREVCAPILLPGYLRGRVSQGSALQARHGPRADGKVHGRLGERREHCNQRNNVGVSTVAFQRLVLMPFDLDAHNVPDIGKAGRFLITRQGI